MREALITGTRISRLTAASALRQRGINADIHERRRRVLGIWPFGQL
jgi:hypothetical protein